MITINAMNEGGDVMHRIKDFSIKYKATDGWRGYYYAVPTKKSRWESVDSSWITGNWSDSGENGSDNVESKLKAIDTNLTAEGYEMAVIFLPTSNVFSTAYEVYKRKT